MTATLRALPLAVLVTAALASTARAQAPAPPATPAPRAPAVEPTAPPAGEAPPAAAPAPSAPPPGYAPAPGYAPPPGYAPAPGYAPPPGYAPAYPPPGYGYPPGYAPYPPPGYAPRYAPPPSLSRAAGYQTHDGTYVRLHFGGGYTAMNTTSNGQSLKISGGSVSIGLAVGGAIAENLIIYGTLTGTSISSPDVSVGGSSLGPGSGSADIFGLGIGLAYYLEPLNLYLAGSLLASQIELDDSAGNQTDATDLGVGGEGIIGKEWWVSENWGLGVAGQVIVASMKGKDTLGTGATQPTWTTSAFSVLFSATFN
jgi:hypothetical protein